jgi:hypothetical protein
MNGNSSEILYLLAKRQGLQRPRFVHAPRQYFLQRIGELSEETRSRRPIRVTHHANQATSDDPEVLGRQQAIRLDRSSMFKKWNKRREQMTLRGSDDRIVPMPSACQAEGDKPSNIGVGKAVGISRDPDLAPSVLSDGNTVITRLDRTFERAKADPEAVFNNLFSMLNYELLWHAFRRLKRGKTPGVDNVTVEDYEEDLEANLRDLLGRLHRGSYRPRPGLRKNIPKGNGKTRALGIACVEDRLVQRAIVMILERIYGSNKKSSRGSKVKRT